VTSSRTNQKKGGTGKAVKLYESKVGKRIYHWGHNGKDQWVFAA
jgi:hypothetical protein